MFKKLWLFFLVWGICFTYPCLARDLKDKSGIQVTVSILPLAEFIERIGGDKVDVSVMIPPGAEPHSYEPLPSQLIELSATELYVKLGSGIEFENVWLKKISGLNPGMVIGNASENIELAVMSRAEDSNESTDEADETYKDPHIWLSLTKARVIAGNIRDMLVTIDPGNAGVYKDNAQKFIGEIDELHRKNLSRFKSLKKRDFIVFHPSWGYFARDYGFNQLVVEVEGKEPTARELINLIGQARDKDIKIIFVSPQFSRRSAEVIAGQIQGKVISIDPLAREYLKNMSEASDRLFNSLR